MRWRFLSLCVICSLFFSSVSNAQQMVFGVVVDSSQQPLEAASVELMSLADSPIAATTTDDSGVFVFENIPDGPYVLNINYIDLNNLDKQITVSGKALDVGNIILKQDPNMLQAVEIIGTVAPVSQKDDTTQYNAGSYKTNPDATAEDLIRKMPGIDVSSGTTKAQGETVSKVLVDGKPFFGDDPTSTLRNLPAEVVDKIQVYDEKSDQSQFTGFDDGQTVKTINIVTKGKAKEGKFGKAYAGYGYDDKYNVGGNINLFKDDRRLSIIGQSNNVNIQNFNSQDLVGISGGGGGGRRGGGGGAGGGMRGGSGGGGNTSNFMVGQQNGISNTNAVGINYSNLFFHDKLDLTASYFFNNSTTNTSQDIDRTYILSTNQGQTYNQNSTTHAENYNHRFNLRMNYKIDSMNSILFVPSVSFQSNNSLNDMFGQTNEAGDALSKILTHSDNDRQGWNAAAQLLYRHKFQKQGRTLSFNVNPTYSSNTTNGKMITDNTYFPTPNLNDSLDQQITNDKYNGRVISQLTYTEPINKKSQLQAQYQLYYSQSDANKQTYNYDESNGLYTDFDSLLSNKFGSNYISHRPGISYRFNDANLSIGGGINYQYAQMNSDRVLPYSYNVKRSFQSVLPTLFMRYKISKSKNLRLMFRTGTDEPSIDQLQDVIDNTNSLQLSSGNPFLVQAYQSSLNLRYSSVNAAQGSNFFALLSASNQHNYITNSTIIAQNDTMLTDNILLAKGSQYMKPINMNGYWNVNAFVTYGRLLQSLKTNVNLNVGVGYTRLPGMVNNQENISNNKSATLGVVFSSNISEKIDFTLSSNSSINFVNYSLNSASNNNYFNQLTRLTFNYIFWKGIVFNTDLTDQLYSGLSQGYNQHFLLWNMSVAKKLFKKQQGEIRLSVFDLLNQNKNISRDITEAYYQDVSTNNLQRYFMLTFTYTLNQFKASANKGVEGNDLTPPGAPQDGRHWHQ